MGCLSYFYRVKTNGNHLLGIQLAALLLGAILMVIKFIAFYLTGSNAILSDALESIINVAAGAFALFSLWFSGRPKDSNHPYGHGKIEFISAGFEGGMIMLAGCYIVYESVMGFIHPYTVQKLDVGIALVAVSGLVNFLLGTWLVRSGKKSRADAMVADGKHLLTDTYTSMGLLAGLLVVWITNLVWLDSLVAGIMGFLILKTGYGLIRRALSGLMDETDPAILGELIPVLNHHRKTEWIDIHNLRMLKYGSRFHIDAHVTLPWYWNLERAHKEISEIDQVASKHFHDEVELFLHADPCIPESCSICGIENCTVRTQLCVKKLEWTLENLLENQKHRV